MINSISEMTAQFFAGEGKKTDDLRSNPAGFEALLALLLSMGLGKGTDNLQGLQQLLSEGTEGFECLMTGRQSLLQHTFARGMDAEGFLKESGFIEGQPYGAETVDEEIMRLFGSFDRVQQEEVSVPGLDVSRFQKENENLSEAVTPVVLNHKSETVQNSLHDRTEKDFDIIEKPNPQNNTAFTEISDQKTEETGERQGVQYIVQRPETLRMLKDVENEAVSGESVKISGEKGLKESKTSAPEDAMYSSFPETSAAGNASDEIAFRIQNDNPMKPERMDMDNIMSQVFDRIKVIKGSGTSEVNISLKPETLGQVTIKLLMEKGVMTGKILVENSYVKNLIESNLPQIKENLKGQNLNVSTFTVSVDLGQGNLPFNQGFFSGRWSYGRKVPVNPFKQEVEEINTAGRNVHRGLLNLLA